MQNDDNKLETKANLVIESEKAVAQEMAVHVDSAQSDTLPVLIKKPSWADIMDSDEDDDSPIEPLTTWKFTKNSVSPETGRNIEVGYRQFLMKCSTS